MEKQAAAERFVTYCDLPFLERYYQMKPSGDTADLDKAGMRWVNVHDFLKHSTDLVVNLSDENLEAQLTAYPFLRHLLPGSRPAGTRTEFEQVPFSRIETPQFHAEEAPPWRLCLLGKTKEPPERLSARTGSLFLGAADIVKDWDLLGKVSELSVSDTDAGATFRAWKDLKPWPRALDAVVISDRYLLKGSIPENVGGLLVSLLPDEVLAEGAVARPVDVTLVTHDFSGNLQRAHQELAGHLKKHRPGLEINLTLVRTAVKKPETHDRYVFLRYGYWKSGQSFSAYFKKGRVSTETTLTYMPILNAAYRQVGVRKLTSLARLVERTKEKIGSVPCVVGSNQNRLLRAVLEAT